MTTKQLARAEAGLRDRAELEAARARVRPHAPQVRSAASTRTDTSHSVSMVPHVRRRNSRLVSRRDVNCR